MSSPDLLSATSAKDPSLDSALLHVLMETLPDRIYFKDLQSRFVRNNLAHTRSLGAETPMDVVGKTDLDFFSKEHAERAFADEQEIIRTGRPVIAKLERLTTQDGKVSWASTTKLPWRDAAGNIIGTFGLSRDVTATRQAEEKLVEERNLLRTIIDHLPSRIYVKDPASHYLLNNRAHLDILGVKTQAEALGHTTLDYFPAERGQQALADDQGVLATGQAIFNQEKSNFGKEGELRWSLTTKVPLRDLRGEIIGLVGISHDITRRKLAEDELQRRSTEMETDVKMARQVQEAFLTRPYPVFPRGIPVEASAVRFAHRYIPATTLGGDFFDLVQLSDTKCGVLVCDVMGHGVRAGLLTALIRGVVEELGERAENPAYVLAEINHSLAPVLEQTGQPVFATAFFGVIDTVANTMAYANAGHPPPLVLNLEHSTIRRLVPADPEPATGLMDGFVYSRHTCAFMAGDLFLGYTDGVLEAADESGQLFGEERIRDVLLRNRGKPCAELANELVTAVERFSGRTIFEDDVCIVAAELTGSTCTIQPLNYDI